MASRLFYGTLTVPSEAAARLDDAAFVEAVRTAPAYRLFSLDGFPVLVEAPEDGGTIGVQVWDVAEQQWADIVNSEPGEMYEAGIELEDGRRVPTLVGPRAWVEGEGAVDVTGHGSWVAYREADG